MRTALTWAIVAAALYSAAAIVVTRNRESANGSPAEPVGNILYRWWTSPGG